MLISRCQFYHSIRQRKNPCQLEQIAGHSGFLGTPARLIQVVVDSAVGNTQHVCPLPGHVGVLGVQRRLVKDAVVRPAGIPHTGKSLVPIQRPPQTEPQLVITCRCIDRCIGHCGEIGNVVQAVVRFAILAHNTGTVNAQHHVQSADRHIVHQLVIGPLEK